MSDGKITANHVVTPNIDVDIPFPVAQNNDEMEAKIRNFNKDAYAAAVEKMNKDLGYIGDGRASERAAELAEELMT